MRDARLLTLTLVIATLAFHRQLLTQVIGQGRDAEQAVETFRVRSQIVTEAVIVTSSDGHPVEGLTAADFTLTEDGVSQKIHFCEYQALPAASPLLPVRTVREEQVKVYQQLSRSQIAPEQNRQYHNRRLLALYFDVSSMDDSDRRRAFAAAMKFVRQGMTLADSVAILRYQNGSVDVLQDFTADRDRLLSILTTLQVGEGQKWSADSSSGAAASDQGAAFGQDDSEFNLFNTDRQLAALQTAAQILGHLSEKKAVIYFAGGLALNGIDNQAQLHATVDTAIRASISFWPVDVRGLVANAPLGNAAIGSPGNIGTYSGLAEQTAQANFHQSQDTLYSLASDTGGKALLDSNDLERGISAAQQSISSHYLLSYYDTNTSLDGRFRRISIKLNRPVVARLDYRRGYYAEKVFSKFTAVDKERQLEDALMLEEPITDLTIAMELNYFQLNLAEYFVPYVVMIPGRELALARRGGADHTLIDFTGEVKDAYGGYTVTNVRDKIDIKLSGSTEMELARLPVQYDAGFTLLPGTYRFKLLARDNETGRMGTYETTFTIPNLNHETRHVPASSVVLSSQRVPLRDAIFNAMKGKQAQQAAAFNPLITDGMKLIPSVNRVFHRGDPLYVYLQGYEYEGDAMPLRPLLCFVSLYRDRMLELQSRPSVVSPTPAPRVMPVPLSFQIDLSHITEGDYICQITLLDPTKGKATFWRAPLRVVH